MLKQLYSVVHNSGYGRRQDGKKAQPRVFRAKLDSGDVIVGEYGFLPIDSAILLLVDVLNRSERASVLWGNLCEREENKRFAEIDDFCRDGAACWGRKAVCRQVGSW